MTRLLSILFICLPFLALAQERLGETRDKLKKELSNFIASNGEAKASLSETDSTLILILNNSSPQKVIHTYSFDDKGKCNSERVSSTCENCITETLKTVLDKKNYKWKKINANQYISRFEDRLLMELPVETKVAYFVIFKTQWTKEIYDILTRD